MFGHNQNARFETGFYSTCPNIQKNPSACTSNLKFNRIVSPSLTVLHAALVVRANTVVADGGGGVVDKAVVVLARVSRAELLAALSLSADASVTFYFISAVDQDISVRALDGIAGVVF